MESFIYLGQIIFVIGFIFAFFIDHLSLSFRIVGYKTDTFPISTLRSTQVMIFNRFGAALFFASSGFLVDLGVSPKDFLLLFSLAWFLLGILTLLYIKSWKTVSAFLADKFSSGKNDISINVIDFRIKDLLTNFPFLFNLLGISAPVMLASFFPDYRASMLQLGFLFNSIATLLLVFVLEPKFIAHLADDESEAADQYHQQLIFSKAMILLLLSIISWLISSICF